MPNSNKVIEESLDARILSLEKLFVADVLSYSGEIVDIVADGFRTALESIVEKKNKIVVVLETNGGYIEVAERIVDTIRHHYKEVEFCVPGSAMSTGTVLVMSGDAIHMDYYSRLGPIDPQIERPGGRGLIPALGYLIQYQRLLSKAEDGIITTAETAILMEKFDQGDLYHFEQARALSITLLKEWLTTYKFGKWVETAERKIPVTEKMKRERAEQIAGILNETETWHSHSRAISMEVLKSKLKLQIDDFGNNPELSKAIRKYHALSSDYLIRRGRSFVIHTRNNYMPLMEI